MVGQCIVVTDDIRNSHCARLNRCACACGVHGQDEHALESHRRAVAAAAAGLTATEIVPVPRPGKGSPFGRAMSPTVAAAGGGVGGDASATRGVTIGTQGSGGSGTPPSLHGVVTAAAAAAAAAMAGPVASGASYVWEDESLAKMDPVRLTSLKPYFRRDGGTVTAGNASPMTDGAAALVVASYEAVQVRTRFVIKKKLVGCLETVGFLQASQQH